MTDDLARAAPTPPRTDDGWAAMRARTPARIGLGRAGDALTTADQLAIRAAHARARDAVHTPLDVEALRTAFDGTPVVAVGSAASDRPTYLQRPDLGRRLADEEARTLTTAVPPDVVFVLADGLSPLAVQRHAVPVVREMTALLDGWVIGPIVIATQARVALGDEIGGLLGARFVVVLIGERPGLSAADSLGLYLTFEPRVGRTDGERNCVSNVRPPVGQGYATAARTVVALLREARRRGLTGVGLKDLGPSLPT